MTGPPYQIKKRQLYTEQASHYDESLEAVIGTETLAQRARWLCEVVEPGHRILDLGCGTGLMLRALADTAGPAGLAAGADLTRAMLNLARERTSGQSNVQLIELDATDHLPFASESFDCVVTVALLQEVATPRSLLEELHRILKPGGILRGIATTYRSLCPAAEIHMAAAEQLPMFLRPQNTIGTMFMQIFGPASATRWEHVPGLSDPAVLGRLFGQPLEPVMDAVRGAGQDPSSIELGLLYMSGRRIA